MSGNVNNNDIILMTESGYQKLKAELVELRSEGRAEIARLLEEARSFGDLSENAEYASAKDAQAKLETRIQWLEFQLSKAKVIDPSSVDSSRVTLGTTITLQDIDTSTIFEYTIVGSEEANPRENKISSSSPVGQAILGKLVNQEVDVRVPKGTRKLKILDIKVI
ncbi:MAG: transcription elongation factor GreA [Synergistales bacterium]|nr:transcription elongation factor GreA [Synergistales bacterium]